MKHHAPPHASITAHFHARARRDVLRKIKKVYGLSDADLIMPIDMQERLDVQFAERMAQPRQGVKLSWEEKCTNAISGSENHENALGDPKIKAATMAAINTAAIKTLRRYTHAFYTRAKVTAQPDEHIVSTGPYRNMDSRANITGVLVNHVSNQAEAELRHAGLNVQHAHDLHGSIIGMAIASYQKVTGDVLATLVEPMLGRLENPSEERIAQRTWALKTSWLTERRLMQEGYRAAQDNAAPAR